MDVIELARRQDVVRAGAHIGVEVPGTAPARLGGREGNTRQCVARDVLEAFAKILPAMARNQDGAAVGVENENSLSSAGAARVCTQLLCPPRPRYQSWRCR